MPHPLATLALVTLAAPALGTGDGIYSFVDGDGVVHYSNVPPDSRYQPVPGLGPARAADGARDARGRPEEQRGESPARLRRAVGSRPGRPAPALRRTAVFDEHIHAAARKYGLAPSLLKAVMAAESNFDPVAVSEKGATGLMQLMPATARDMYVYDILDPAQNIEGGARYLRLLQDRFPGDLERVLAAYNAGPERVRRPGAAVPPIPETEAYVRRVLRLYAVYSRER